MENQIKHSFKINTKIMRFLSWYPPKTESVLYTIKGYFLYFSLLVLVTALTIAKIVIEKQYDNMQIVYLSEAVSYCFKLLSFLQNGRRIKNCINYFNGPAFAPRDNVEKSISDIGVKLCQKLSLAYIVSITCSVIMYLFPSLFSKNYYIPLRIWLPFDPMSAPITYYLTLIYIFAACMYAGFATSLIEPLIGGLAFHAVSQLKIMKHRLKNLQVLSVEQDEAVDDCWDDFTVYKNLITCIQHHSIILKFVREYEKCFSWAIFSQFLGTTFFICFSCIGLSTVSFNNVEAVTYSIFFVLANSQILFFCYFGQLLFQENDTLITAIYTSEWYEYDAKAKKLLIILMERTKRPMIITAEKLVDVTLETFTKIIRRSYSLIAVLK